MLDFLAEFCFLTAGGFLLGRTVPPRTRGKLVFVDMVSFAFDRSQAILVCISITVSKGRGALVVEMQLNWKHQVQHLRCRESSTQKSHKHTVCPLSHDRTRGTMPRHPGRFFRAKNLLCRPKYSTYLQLLPS